MNAPQLADGTRFISHLNISTSKSVDKLRRSQFCPKSEIQIGHEIVPAACSCPVVDCYQAMAQKNLIVEK